MKKTRIGIGKKRRRSNIAVAVLFLFVLPLIAIGIGSRITEWLVIPTINTNNILKLPEDLDLNYDRDKDINREDNNNINEEKDNVSNLHIEDDVTKEVANLNAISIYTIQIASIAENKNLELLGTQLNNYKIPYTIYKLDNTYKIYTFTSTKRENLEVKLGEIKETYNDAYIAHINIPQKHIYYMKDENNGTEEITESLNLLLELLVQSLDIMNKSNNEEIKLAEYSKVLEKQQNILNQIIKKVNDINLPKEFVNNENIKNMIEFQEKSIVESLKIINEGGNLYKLENYLLDNLFNMIHIIGI